MNKRTKYILIGVASGVVFSLIAESSVMLLFMLMGGGAGYALSLENIKLKYILTGLFLGGPLGCLVGYLIWVSKYDTSAQSGQNAGNQQETAEENNSETRKQKKLSIEEEQTQFCIAAWGLAQATCWADGDKGEVENNEAKQILKTLMENFPEDQQKSILVKAKQFNENKPQPTLEDAIVEIEKLNKPDYMILDSIVQRIVRSDNEISEKEQSFLTSWQQYMDSKQ